MNPTARRTQRLLAAAVATTLTTGLALSATACTTGGSAGRSDEPSPDRSSTARPHGWVEGASEAQEPQLRLLAVSASGTTTLHDLLGGAATSLDAVDAPAHSATDGRFLVTSDADRTTITDGGAWTVDHGDHTHYYTADPRVVGVLDGGGPVAVHSSETVTTISWPERRQAVVLDRAALGQGDVDVTARLEAAVLLPFGDGLVAATDAGVRLLDADGEPVGAATPCAAPAGGTVTRAAAAVGCADGAVLVAEDGTATVVPLPDGAERPTSFAARGGRPTVAGTAGDRGAWLLDTREGSWRLVQTERPLRTVVAVDDQEEHVVGVDDLGRVVVLTVATGAVATTGPLLDPDAEPFLQLDAQRAYVADDAGPRVHEVDFADGARVARTIELPAAPAALAEVGL
ncbi:lipoprotein [Curtobacterium citreum]|uniref:ABC transporter n=1 Tax=Curtobacterium citreum TaxID=2036 RepID=A0ABT2HKG7_9MICO|nr:ABC transporter [Curtobacterium citreum]MCS6523628.1 ABC transporter [Curtobacterium citreum]TQJ26580.1 hypothetical protein FB462_0419 [Curtobacterium citreum]GGL85816.1 lipoprotein [Curtobacterium citreum]